MLRVPEHPLSWLRDRAEDSPGVAAIRDERGALSYRDLWSALGRWHAALAHEAADLLFSGDPTAASPEAFTTLAAEIPTSTLTAAELDDPVAVFVAAGLATSNGDARRSLAQRSYYANGVQLDEDALAKYALSSSVVLEAQ